ncbi:cupredoxin family protein [Hyphomicrobium sp.]|uniref:cupredoxin domain-containing protein n=1 Tax=Hyphomicrobium sp. TaxID=82 RepID=UPI000FA9F314|nr:cupredoxin family protein [Hyphomicrobium sp.]RUO98588.1 MAG: copper resistance protein [Hyphomicrobium sp.]
MNRTMKAFAVAFVLGTAIHAMPPTLMQASAHDDDDDFAAGEPGDPTKQFRTIEITMSERDGAMVYAPASVEVARGEQIQFVIRNAGALKHEFHLASVAQNASHLIEMQKNPEMVHDEPNVQTVEPGGTAELFWRFSKPGEFEFACLIPGHYEAGMHGKVVVK